MNVVCSLNFFDVNVLVYLVCRPRTAGIVSFIYIYKNNQILIFKNQIIIMFSFN